MRWIDTPTLILVVAAGLHLGLLGVFGLDVIGRVFSGYNFIVYDLMGVSAIWQLFRQRFF
jgi:uncharacterized membrane protein YuzA (DUF378 family)